MVCALADIHGGGEEPLSHALLVSTGIRHLLWPLIILIVILVVIGASLLCAMLFFGHPRNARHVTRTRSLRVSSEG